MSDVIIACDFSSKEETLKFLDQFKEEKPFVKIGMELFDAEGDEIVKEIKKRGHKIFLDLKLCDIPNTVYKAMKNIAALGVDMTNVHAFGSIEMMKAAKKAINEVNPETKLIAVTVLTSSDQNVLDNELMIDGNINDVILKYASNTKEAGLDGVVCSPLEAASIKEECGNDFITVTPGIRFADSDAGDQKRIMTPANAGKAGCDYIVMGRPITKASDPVGAYRRAMHDFLG